MFAFENDNQGLRIVVDKTTLEVHLQPGAKSDGIVGLREGVLWVRVTAPPLKGQANRALLELLARALALPKSHLALIRGQASRHKVMVIHGLSREELEERLATENTKAAQTGQPLRQGNRSIRGLDSFSTP